MASERAARSRIPPFIDPRGTHATGPRRRCSTSSSSDTTQSSSRARAAGRPLPKYVQDEFAAYLKCGRLEHGFLRVRCENWITELLMVKTETFEDDVVTTGRQTNWRVNRTGHGFNAHYHWTDQSSNFDVPLGIVGRNHLPGAEGLHGFMEYRFWPTGSWVNRIGPRVFFANRDDMSRLHLYNEFSPQLQITWAATGRSTSAATASKSCCAQKTSSGSPKRATIRSGATSSASKRTRCRSLVSAATSIKAPSSTSCRRSARSPSSRRDSTNSLYQRSWRRLGRSSYAAMITVAVALPPEWCESLLPPECGFRPCRASVSVMPRVQRGGVTIGAKRAFVNVRISLLRSGRRDHQSPELGSPDRARSPLRACWPNSLNNFPAITQE